MKFVLLHEGKNDDGIRQFFADVWELYVKVSDGCCWAVGGSMFADNAEPLPYGAHNDPEYGI